MTRPAQLLALLLAALHASTCSSVSSVDLVPQAPALGLLRKVIKVGWAPSPRRAMAASSRPESGSVAEPVARNVQDVKGEEHMEGAGVKITRTVSGSRRQCSSRRARMPCRDVGPARCTK